MEDTFSGDDSVQMCDRRLLLGDYTRGSQGNQVSFYPKPSLLDLAMDLCPGAKSTSHTWGHKYTMALMSPGLCDPCHQATCMVRRWKINIGLHNAS